MKQYEITAYATHNYHNDTKLEYKKNGNEVELKLSFTSEDPDCGTEEMTCSFDDGEKLHMAAQYILIDLAPYNDEPCECSDDTIQYYENYTRTALIAFENMLREFA